MRSRWSCGRSTSSTSAGCSALAGDAGRSGGGDRAAGDDARDRAGEGRARRASRAAIRTRSTTRCRTRELQALTPQFHVGALLHRHRLAADLRAQRRRAGLLQGVRPDPRRARRSPRSRPTCAGRSRTPRPPCCRSRSSTRTSRSTATTLTGAQGAAAALEALRRSTPTAISAKRSARRSSSEAFGAAGQGRHAEDGPRARGGARAATSTASTG